MRVYTDGACSGNPGPGGWAWATEDGRTGSGGEPQTTNQRMELQAVLEAVRSVPGELVIVSDSTYVVNCFNDRWYEGWIKRGWKNSAKKPVANRDLWEPLVEHYLGRRPEIEFEWVKGHSGDPMNDLVDQLAVEACRLQRVDADPAATENSPIEPAVAPWEAGRAVWIVGATELSRDQRSALLASVDRLDPTRDLAISGLRRGAELVGAERARSRGVPIGVVLPFPDPADGWPESDRERFDAVEAAAHWRVVLTGDMARPGAAVADRNAWIRSSVTGAIVVGDADLVEELDEAGLGVVEIP